MWSGHGIQPSPITSEIGGLFEVSITGFGRMVANLEMLAIGC